MRFVLLLIIVVLLLVAVWPMFKLLYTATKKWYGKQSDKFDEEVERLKSKDEE